VHARNDANDPSAKRVHSGVRFVERSAVCKLMLYPQEAQFVTPCSHIDVTIFQSTRNSSSTIHKNASIDELASLAPEAAQLHITRNYGCSRSPYISD